MSTMYPENFRTDGTVEDTDAMLDTSDTVVNHVCGDCGDLLRTIADVNSHVCTGGQRDRDAIGGIVSEADGSLDTLVEQASVPNLASLFKKGKQQGLIKAGKTEGASF